MHNYQIVPLPLSDTFVYLTAGPRPSPSSIDLQFVAGNGLSFDVKN